MEKVMKDMLPIMGVEHDCLLSKQGDITVGYTLTLPEIFTLSDDEYEAFHQSWVKAIKLLPKFTVMHKQDWYIGTKYQRPAREDEGFLAHASAKHFAGRPYLGHTCYLFITKK